MTCTCKNEDGTLSGTCNGQCVKSKVLVHDENAKRDPLNGFAEMIMGQVEKLINYRLSELKINFEKSQLNTYKEAFIEGLIQGVKIVKNHHDYD